METRERKVLADCLVNQVMNQEYATSVMDACRQWYFSGMELLHEQHRFELNEGTIFLIYPSAGVEIQCKVHPMRLKLPAVLQHFLPPVNLKSRTLDVDLLFPVCTINELEVEKGER